MVSAEGVKTWCLTWPKRAFLVGCLGGGVLGFLVAMGQEKDTNFDNWWISLGICFQIGLMILAEAREAWRKKLLAAAFGVFFYASGAIFEAAHAADVAGEDGLATGYAFSIMACGFSWLVFAPPPSTSLTALKQHLPEVVLAAGTVFATFFLWFDKTSLTLACNGGAAAFLFLTAVANDKTPISAWIAQFTLTWVWLNAMAVWVASEEGTEVAGAFMMWVGTILSSLMLGFRTMFGAASDEGFNREISSVTGNLNGQLWVVSLLLVLIGAPLSTDVDGKTRGQEWYSTASFFTVVLMLFVRQFSGGRRTWFMLWAGAWLLTLTKVCVSYGVFTNQFDESTASTGYAFLLMGMWLSFLSLGWVPVSACLAVVKPDGDKRGLLRTLGVVVVVFATFLGIISQMAEPDAQNFNIPPATPSPTPAYSWESLVTLCFFLAAHAEGSNPLAMWVLLVWSSLFQFELMDALRQSTVDFETAALFFMWAGWVTCTLATIAYVEEPIEEELTDEPSATGVVPGQAIPTPGVLAAPVDTTAGGAAAATPNPNYDQSADAIPMGAPVEPVPAAMGAV